MYAIPTKEWKCVNGKLVAVTCGAAICDNAVVEAEREGQKKGLRKALRKFSALDKSNGVDQWRNLRDYIKVEISKLDVSR